MDDVNLKDDKIFETDQAIFYKVTDVDDQFFINQMREFPNDWSFNPLSKERSFRQFFSIYTKDGPIVLISLKNKNALFGAVLLHGHTLMVFDQRDRFPFKEMVSFVGLTKKELIGLFKK